MEQQEQQQELQQELHLVQQQEQRQHLLQPWKPCLHCRPSHSAWQRQSIPWDRPRCQALPPATAAAAAHCRSRPGAAPLLPPLAQVPGLSPSGSEPLKLEFRSCHRILNYMTKK